MSTARFALGILAVALAAAHAVGQTPKTITVSAGDSDRRDTIVPVTLPAGADPGMWVLRDEAGKPTPLQTGPTGRGRFILGDLKAGQTRRYRLERSDGGRTGPETPVDLQRTGGTVKFSSGGREILQYRGDKTPLPAGYEAEFHRGGYIHPLYTPSGKLVTDDYPPKHKHHHGVWSPWTKTKFEGRAPDFWNMGAKTGTVEFVGLSAAWGGPGDNARVRKFLIPAPGSPVEEAWCYPYQSTKLGGRVSAFSPDQGTNKLYAYDTAEKAIMMSGVTCTEPAPTPFAPNIDSEVVDIAVDAFTRLQLPLVVAGTGPELAALRRRAGPTIRFLGWTPDDALARTIAGCRALIFPGEEDFGIVPVEAMAAGRPVIAFRRGGALDSVIDGETGLFFDEQTAESLASAVRRFDAEYDHFDSDRIAEHAERFDREHFTARFAAFVDERMGAGRRTRDDGGGRWRMGGGRLTTAGRS